LARVVIELTEWKSHSKEDIRNSCGKQIRTGWSSESSDSSETGFKEKPAGVLRTERTFDEEQTVLPTGKSLRHRSTMGADW